MDDNYFEKWFFFSSKFSQNDVVFMGKEIQERADEMIKELKDALVPIKEEIRKLKGSSDRSI